MPILLSFATPDIARHPKHFKCIFGEWAEERDRKRKVEMGKGPLKEIRPCKTTLSFKEPSF